MPAIAMVVEGDGESDAFPLLLRRILYEEFQRFDIAVGGKATGVVNAHGRSNLISRLEELIGHALEKPDCAGILVLLDSDEDCPVALDKSLAERCRQSGADARWPSCAPSGSMRPGFCPASKPSEAA